MAEKWGQVKAVYGEKESKFYVDPMMANEFIFSIVNSFFFFFILQVKSSSPNNHERPNNEYRLQNSVSSLTHSFVCSQVVLETEITNKSALKLYENLGFVRDKRLFRYYLNGVDALRLKLWLR